jgi:crotonyl-CoA reductase
MSLKRIIGSHFANYREAWQANRLIAKAMIHPTMSAVYPLDQAGQAAWDVHRNLHHGKVAVLCLAPAKASASATTNCAPSTCPRSTGSGTSKGAAERMTNRPWLMRTYAGHSSTRSSGSTRKRPCC